MALPKRKTSKSRQGTRISHESQAAPNLSPCPQCHSPKPSHLVCPICGSYRGREVTEGKRNKG